MHEAHSAPFASRSQHALLALLWALAPVAAGLIVHRLQKRSAPSDSSG